LTGELKECYNSFVQSKSITLFGSSWWLETRDNGDYWLVQTQRNDRSLRQLNQMVQAKQLGKQVNWKSVLIRKDSLEWVLLNAV